MRCPFGCREHHRREKAKERIKEYYHSKEGKMKKKRLNQKRYLLNEIEGSKNEARNFSSGDEDFMDYISWMLSLTEGKKVSKAAAKKLLNELETTPPVEIKLSG